MSHIHTGVEVLTVVVIQKAKKNNRVAILVSDTNPSCTGKGRGRVGAGTGRGREGRGGGGRGSII